MYVEDIPKDTTYGDITDTFCPFKRIPPLEIVTKEHYAVITFVKPKTVRKILRKKDQLTIKGKNITIKEAIKQFKPKHIHLPPSFLLPVNVVFPPIFSPIAPPPPPQSSSPPPPPSTPYIHPSLKGFHISIINSLLVFFQFIYIV